MSTSDTYYRDHWLEIEPERLEAYERLFEWRDAMQALIAPADLREGQSVVDYGCGPGHLAVELARRVGAQGLVHALDINTEFLERSRRRAARAGFAERVRVARVEGSRLPLEDDSVDRVVCKNVFEYLPDPAETLGEFRRVLRPGGIAHVSDSDWGALIVEPIGPERLARVMEAAKVAFRTPLIGRQLYGLFRAAGFRDVEVRVLASADLAGHLLPVLSNMATYARSAAALPDAELDAFLKDVEAALEAGRYFALLPQFLVTGRTS